MRPGRGALADRFTGRGPAEVVRASLSHRFRHDFDRSARLAAILVVVLVLVYSGGGGASGGGGGY